MRTQANTRRIVRFVPWMLAVLLLAWPAQHIGASSARRHVFLGAIEWKTKKLPPAVGGHAASFGEPGIATGPDGTLVVTAARANAGYPTWWFSRNEGARWGPGRDLDTSGAMTGDADAAFGSDGSVYALNLAFQNPPQQPTNPAILVYSRPRGAGHWHGPATFPPPHGADQPDRPWLAAGQLSDLERPRQVVRRVRCRSNTRPSPRILRSGGGGQTIRTKATPARDWVDVRSWGRTEGLDPCHQHALCVRTKLTTTAPWIRPRRTTP